MKELFKELKQEITKNTSITKLTYQTLGEKSTDGCIIDVNHSIKVVDCNCIKSNHHKFKVKQAIWDVQMVGRELTNGS